MAASSTCEADHSGYKTDSLHRGHSLQHLTRVFRQTAAERDKDHRQDRRCYDDCASELRRIGGWLITHLVPVPIETCDNGIVVSPLLSVTPQALLDLAGERSSCAARPLNPSPELILRSCRYEDVLCSHP